MTTVWSKLLVVSSFIHGLPEFQHRLARRADCWWRVVQVLNVEPRQLRTGRRSGVKDTGHEVKSSPSLGPPVRLAWSKTPLVARELSCERIYTADQLSTNSAGLGLSMLLLVRPIWLWGTARTLADPKAALTSFTPIASFARFKEGTITSRRFDQ